MKSTSFLKDSIKSQAQDKCPCHSHKVYGQCCEPFHKQSKKPESAVELMRSRYSAYALCVPDYIISTTHPENSSYSKKKEEWKKQIIQFSKTTHFGDLKILAFSQEEKVAYVTFFAFLLQESKNVSFKEESLFIKENGLWLYHSGKLLMNLSK